MTLTFLRIRLATHLYAENLLDRMVFLEWYLSFFETSALDVLPLVIVLAPTFWEDLLKLRRFSRRLAEVLLAKSEAVCDPDATTSGCKVTSFSGHHE